MAKVDLSMPDADLDTWDSPFPEHLKRKSMVAVSDVTKLKVIPVVTAEQIASKAAAIVGGERAKQHGNKRDNFDNIAKLWTAWLRINHTLSKDLSGADVAKMMVLLKIARMESGAFNPDDALDACGYAAIAGELARGEQ